jgi:hypothetical protein
MSRVEREKERSAASSDQGEARRAPYGGDGPARRQYRVGGKARQWRLVLNGGGGGCSNESEGRTSGHVMLKRKDRRILGVYIYIGEDELD